MAIRCQKPCHDCIQGSSVPPQHSTNRIYNAANNLKFALPVERKDEADMVLAVLDKANGGQGPGFTLLGVVVRSSTVWSLAGGMVSVIAGAAMSVMIDMESTTTVSTGSFGA